MWYPCREGSVRSGWKGESAAVSWGSISWEEKRTIMLGISMVAEFVKLVLPLQLLVRNWQVAV